MKASNLIFEFTVDYTKTEFLQGILLLNDEGIRYRLQITNCFFALNDIKNDKNLMQLKEMFRQEISTKLWVSSTDIRIFEMNEKNREIMVQFDIGNGKWIVVDGMVLKKKKKRSSKLLPCGFCSNNSTTE